MVFYTIWAFYLKSNNMKKISKYQTTQLFNSNSERLNGYENFVALTKDDNLVHTKKNLFRVLSISTSLNQTLRE